jgi:ATP-dependent Clp protease ATP-binding subunit ClpA
MFERFTEESRRALFLARVAADQAAGVEPEHLLVGIALLDPPPSLIGAVTNSILVDLGFTSSILGLQPRVNVPLGSAVQQLLIHATTTADESGHNRIRPEHLLLALCDGHQKSANLLREANVERTAIVQLAQGLAARGDEPPLPYEARRDVRIR